MISGILRRTATGALAPAALLLALTCPVLGHRAWALLPSEASAELRVNVYVLWNQDYLCLAAKVADPMLTGSSLGPMSAPQEDDAIEFDLEVPGRAGPEAHRLIISAAGGMAVLSRDPRGQWRSDPSWISGPQTLKYAVSLDGTLNKPGDGDVGFTVESAIPWSFLGGEPRPGGEIGFNVVCWMQGESEGLVSWAQGVRSEQDVGEAARWGRMLIAPSSAPAKAQPAWLLAPYAARTPFVDGKLSAEEWLTASTLALDKPKPALEPAPVGPAEKGAVGTLLAIYRYDWQGNLDRPGAHLWLPDGRPATGDQPREAAGPWYSYDRAAWHRQQLDGLQRSGIDVLLARYRGDDESRRTWARAGLERLSEALKGMRAEGRGYPLVGMMLDTAALQGVDLKTAEEKRLVYGMIRDFFLHVPREFWAELAARPQEGLAGGVPVLLGEPDSLGDWDGGFLAFSQENFARDFDGARLVWLGSSQWRAKGAEGFYAYVRLPTLTEFSQEATGGATAVALSPGHCPGPGGAGEVRSRREGRAYRSAWQRALAAAPELVVLNSWNDFASGNELAPSRQYGIAYVDLTRYFSARLGSREAHQLRLKQQAAPPVMQPGADYQVEFLVENVGTEDLRSGRRVTADYRIVRREDGKVVQSRIAAQDLDIMAGQTLRLPVRISTKDSNGDPLPPGEYLFSLIAMRSRVAYLRSQWFARPAAELTVPITVGEPPARAATVISTSLPSSMEAGATRQVMVRLRNDGSDTWRAQGTRLSYRWLRHDDDLTVGPGQTRATAVAGGNGVSLPRDVAPGQMVSVMIPVRSAGADGSPLMPSRPEDLWHYRVEWGLVDAEAGWSPATSEAIQVTASESGARFELEAAGLEMQAGEKSEVAVVVGNAGGANWEAGAWSLVGRWHRWDGRELGREPARVPLASEVEPGGKVTLNATVEAPLIPGPYWLVWDMAAEGEGQARGGGEPADLLVTPVTVRGGSFRPVDLSELANVTAVTHESRRSRGDFDAQGRSLPAEWVPPDQSGVADRVYPSGYYSPSASEPVPFLFPDTGSGAGSAVACNGQSVALGETGARRVHLLVGRTAGPETATFALERSDGAREEAAVTVPLWTEIAPESPATVGLYVPYLRTLSGDDGAASAALYHVVLEARSGEAVSLGLPTQPGLRILAITAEGG